MRQVLLLMTIASDVQAKGDFSVREILLDVWREPDGKKYPNQVKESYAVEADGRLSYTAYFGGMPTNMNHMDSVEWAASAEGKALVKLATRLANAGALKKVADDEHAPEGAVVYFVGVTRNQADSTQVASDSKTAAWRELDAAFRALVKKFERETGRPKKPTELPQH
jgi:hypothetical protein